MVRIAETFVDFPGRGPGPRIWTSPAGLETPRGTRGRAHVETSARIWWNCTFTSVVGFIACKYAFMRLSSACASHAAPPDDPICAICASDGVREPGGTVRGGMLIVARESGMLQRYTLPHVSPARYAEPMWNVSRSPHDLRKFWSKFSGKR